MDTSGDGVLFCGQTETVITQRVQHVVALHAFEACIDIGADVSKRVPYVQAST